MFLKSSNKDKRKFILIYKEEFHTLLQRKTFQQQLLRVCKSEISLSITMGKSFAHYSPLNLTTTTFISNHIIYRISWNQGTLLFMIINFCEKITLFLQT